MDNNVFDLIDLSRFLKAECPLKIKEDLSERTLYITSKNSNNVSSKQYHDNVDNFLKLTRQLIPYRSFHFSDGFIAIKFKSNHQALWFEDQIGRYNIETRVKGKHLLIPVNDDFTLNKEIKKIMIALIKVLHYWKEHRSLISRVRIIFSGHDEQMYYH